MNILTIRCYFITDEFLKSKLNWKWSNIWEIYNVYVFEFDERMKIGRKYIGIVADILDEKTFYIKKKKIWNILVKGSRRILEKWRRAVRTAEAIEDAWRVVDSQPVLVAKYPRATFESDRITVARYSRKREVVEKLRRKENR